MRISHRRKKPVEPKKIFYYNEGIRAPKVLVLDSTGGNLGVMNTAEAIRLAREQEMDLVEINPKIDPPVVRIMDFGQYQYQQEKQTRLRKAHQHVTKTKCIRLSLRIGQHDMEIRKEHILEFLESGDKVKVEVLMRGRENQRPDLAFELLRKFIGGISGSMKIKYDQEVEKQGNAVTAVIFKS